MLRYYLKTPPLKKILQFQAKFDFLLKTQENHSSASDWWENTKSSFKENSKNSTIQENIRILRLKQDCKPYTKKKNSNQKLNH